MKHVIVLMAATTIGGAGISAASAANPPTTAPSALHAPAVDEIKKIANAVAATASDASIREVLANVTSDALTNKDMSKLATFFDDAARQRIASTKTYGDNYGNKLDDKIAQISKDWKQKYGHDFTIKNPGGTFGDVFASIQIGAVGHNDKLIADELRAAGLDTAKTGDKDQTRSEIRTGAIALLDIKGVKSGADLQVPFVSDKSGNWKIVVPESMTAEKLRQNLTNQLTALGDHSAQWPANETDAYRQVTHHVLMAIMDKSPVQRQASAAPVAKPLPQANKPTPAIPVSTNATHRWWQFWYW